MIRLAHISDPHLGPLPAFSRGELLAKQRIGHLNWRRNRERVFEEKIRLEIEADMHESNPDQIAVTGDLINLGLSSEIDAAAEWLTTLGEPDHVMVVPGNHDAYVPSAVPHYERAWLPYMRAGTGETPEFPYVRRAGGTALIGLSSATPSMPLLATGRLGREQIGRLAATLRSLGEEKLCRVIVMHHPPDRRANAWHKMLTDAAAFRRVLAAEGADLVIHGHNHVNRCATLRSRNGDIPVIGVAALCRRPHKDRPGGSWNLYEIDGAGGIWRITMTTRAKMPSGRMETIAEARLTA